MRLARHHHEVGGQRAGAVPMTSMIDVVFLLLIYFMLTVSATPPESELSSTLSPQSEQQGAGAVLQPQVVSVERVGESVVFRLGAHAFADKDSLGAVLRELPKNSGVVVKVANNVPVEAAAAALQACKDTGFTKVSYVPAG